MPAVGCRCWRLAMYRRTSDSTRSNVEKLKATAKLDWTLVAILLLGNAFWTIELDGLTHRPKFGGVLLWYVSFLDLSRVSSIYSRICPLSCRIGYQCWRLAFYRRISLYIACDKQQHTDQRWEARSNCETLLDTDRIVYKFHKFSSASPYEQVVTELRFQLHW